MALIYCPECKKQISNKADYCPHCGLPKSYFAPDNHQEKIISSRKIEEKSSTNYKVIRNMLIAFDKDYTAVFNTGTYITTFHDLWDHANPGLFIAEQKDKDAYVVCASIQSVAKNIDDFRPDDFGYVIIDECHHGAASTYKKILGYFKPEFTLGLTKILQIGRMGKTCSKCLRMSPIN